ncbi:hypothetical protein TW95_gp1620 [Pandoravirus inopinatum]|uniref:Uncharacterized protein n=1 Tax=Pandoravirus inopinatum TaxID=1605721 RepID=A0A0B5J412_9VIRU|nr:hypothetical protein TW95_gp1620 [Pandoravirus inopinatum]AJF98354.1 hypothetical protein [Pandoravirus inopinatum]
MFFGVMVSIGRRLGYSILDLVFGDGGGLFLSSVPVRSLCGVSCGGGSLFLVTDGCGLAVVDVQAQDTSPFVCPCTDTRRCSFGSRQSFAIGHFFYRKKKMAKKGGARKKQKKKTCTEATAFFLFLHFLFYLKNGRRYHR